MVYFDIIAPKGKWPNLCFTLRFKIHVIFAIFQICTVLVPIEGKSAYKCWFLCSMCYHPLQTLKGKGHLVQTHPYFDLVGPGFPQRIIPESFIQIRSGTTQGLLYRQWVVVGTPNLEESISGHGTIAR